MEKMSKLNMLRKNARSKHRLEHMLQCLNITTSYVHKELELVKKQRNKIKYGVKND